MKINREQYSAILKLLPKARDRLSLEDQYRLHVSKFMYEMHKKVDMNFMHYLNNILKKESKNGTKS